MLDKYRSLINSRAKIKLVRNLFSLSVLQAYDLLLPLLLIPYLISTLGVDKFGLLSFATVLVAYFQIAVDYGFNTTATRDISINIDNPEKIEEIYNNVMSTKIALLLVCFLVLSAVVFGFHQFSSHPFIYLFTYGVVIGQSFVPIWFFQGMQEVRYVTYSNIIGKSVFALAIFIFVKHEQDYFLVPIFTSLGFIVSGTFAFLYIRSKFLIKFKFQSFKSIKEQLIYGKYMFLSELKTALITNTNVLVLGIMSGNQAVAYFVGADKIIRAFGNIQAPVLNAFFPFISKKINSHKGNGLRLINKIIKIGSIIIILFSAIIFYYAEFIITLILKSDMYNSIIVFKILLLIPLASFLDVILGKHILLNLNKGKQYFRVFLVAAIINFPIVLGLTYYFSFIGTAIAQMLIQIFIVFGMLYYVRREYHILKEESILVANNK